MLTCIYVLFQACGKDAKCKDFSSDERAWVPFSDGDVFAYKNIGKDTVITLKVRKADVAQLQQWWLENPDPIHGFDLSISIRNGQTNKKNSYYFNLKAIPNTI